jgi:tetraacyldisaccharide-1-P 4'-kinase
MLICFNMDRVPAAFVPVVYIPGLAYEALVRTRNCLYSSAILAQHRLPAPVISIGNITLGGSGKTPLVIRVAQILVKLGYTPAVLTRGYGRAHPNKMRIVAPHETVPNPAATLGDEPALIQRHIPSAWLGISKNRLEAGNTIAGRDPKAVFVLDDGFQHRKLHRDLDVVIIDMSQPLKSNRVFPRGTLREPVSGLQRCDMVVLHGLPREAEPVGLELGDYLKPGATILPCEQRIQAFVPFRSWRQSAPGSQNAGEPPCFPKATPGRPALPGSAYLVSALGNPERFQSDIRRMGIAGPGATFFPDHHQLSQKDWQNCVERARRKKADTIITTEKDAVKITEPPDFPLLVAVQTTRMADTGKFETVLKNCIEGRL